MDCICCGEHKELEELDEGCSITRIPIIHGDEHKRHLVRVFLPTIEGVYKPTVHYDCVHNQVQSIRNRVCGVVPKPTSLGKEMLRKAVKQITTYLQPTIPDDIYDLSRRHVGSKAERYKRAADMVTIAGVSKVDASIKMFIKAERFNPLAKTNPDPRSIQFRGARFSVCLAMYLRPIEEQIYQFSRASDGVPHTRNVAKGLNAVDRATLLVEKAKPFRRPVFLTLDAQRFDKHIAQDHLKAEHSVYLASNPDPMFRRLLSWQLVNKCFTTLGVRYTTKGRRMSGDMNTAIGNIVIMLLMVMAVMRFMLQILKWDVLDDGDDFVLIVEEDDVDHLMAELPGRFLEFGMEMKMDSPARGIHEVEFCQSKIIEFAMGKYKFVRDFRTVISRATSGVRNWDNQSYRSRTIHAIGTCELVLGLGVPVLQSYALCLLRNSRGDKDPVRHAPDGIRARAMRDAALIGIKDLTNVGPQPIQPCARDSFFLAFGLSPVEQVRLEKYFEQVTFNDYQPIFHGGEIDVGLWVYDRPTTSESYPL